MLYKACLIFFFYIWQSVKYESNFQAVASLYVQSVVMLLVHDATGDVDACYGAPQGTLEKKKYKAKCMRDLTK